MRLSVSNIGWNKEYNEEIFKLLSSKKYDAIEIAPTAFIGDDPYNHIDLAVEEANRIKKEYNLSISSMQSIWYGKQGNIFNKDDAEMFIEYTKRAIDFAHAINCHNLVFGCPKNRIKPRDINDEKVIDFFKELGDYAYKKNTIISIEPNPTIYGTNFINYTKDAFEFVKKVDSLGIKVNVDFGTIIQNDENLEIIRNNIDLVNHIHISEPNLEKIKFRKEHIELLEILKETNYPNYISIEMKKTENIEDLKQTIEYVSSIFR